MNPLGDDSGLLALFGACTAIVLLVVFALPVSAQSSGWQPGPGAILDNTYVGFIEQPASGNVAHVTCPQPGQVRPCA